LDAASEKKDKATPHGFRATGSTILNESGCFERDWIKLELAHQERDSVRAAYNSARYLSQRRDQLQWWRAISTIGALKECCAY
jgi:integrase